MVATTFFAKVSAAAGAIAAAAMTVAPAYANSSSTADIAAPLRAADAARVPVQAPVQAADKDFRNLFSSWRSMDRGAYVPSAAGAEERNAVSIPSRVPVEGVRLSSDFGMRWHPILGGRHVHKGVDLAGPVGTPVLATADGVVGRADWFSSYGLYVQLEHGADLETRYGHLSRLNVAAGQFVHKGDVIGYIGTTGRSTGPHLHYEVRVSGLAVNPIPYMQADASMDVVNATAATAITGATEVDSGDE